MIDPWWASFVMLQIFVDISFTLNMWTNLINLIASNHLLYIKLITVIMGHRLYKSLDFLLNPFQVLHRLILL